MIAPDPSSPHFRLGELSQIARNAAIECESVARQMRSSVELSSNYSWPIAEQAKRLDALAGLLRRESDRIMLGGAA